MLVHGAEWKILSSGPVTNVVLIACELLHSYSFPLAWGVFFTFFLWQMINSHTLNPWCLKLQKNYLTSLKKTIIFSWVLSHLDLREGRITQWGILKIGFFFLNIFFEWGTKCDPVAWTSSWDVNHIIYNMLQCWEESPRAYFAIPHSFHFWSKEELHIKVGFW